MPELSPRSLSRALAEASDAAHANGASAELRLRTAHRRNVLQRNEINRTIAAANRREQRCVSPTDALLAHPGEKTRLLPGQAPVVSPTTSAASDRSSPRSSPGSYGVYGGYGAVGGDSGSATRTARGPTYSSATWTVVRVASAALGQRAGSAPATVYPDS
ncbi:hypothetical protein M885DRAFT_511354 [Pelagophyceae sp. CCMP2097]|nr:hypothetical protein M885DRAFT_511354 [Pelagophyceae sp. CCMP2097]